MSSNVQTQTKSMGEVCLDTVDAEVLDMLNQASRFAEFRVESVAELVDISDAEAEKVLEGLVSAGLIVGQTVCPRAGWSVTTYRYFRALKAGERTVYGR